MFCNELLKVDLEVDNGTADLSILRKVPLYAVLIVLLNQMRAFVREVSMCVCVRACVCVRPRVL